MSSSTFHELIIPRSFRDLSISLLERFVYQPRLEMFKSVSKKNQFLPYKRYSTVLPTLAMGRRL